jgi:NADP-dependent 3-hydroxy acid dehydrogenase YdfG
MYHPGSKLKQILVNNAGVLEPGRLVAETDIDTWCRTWDVNVKVMSINTD